MNRLKEMSHHLSLKIGGVDSIGLSGSRSEGFEDNLSDFDICVFATDAIPSAESRRETYHALGFTSSLYFDLDFDPIRSDCMSLAEVQYDFGWMSLPKVLQYLQLLCNDFDCDEGIAGALLKVQPLHDPKSRIGFLRNQIPVYSESRMKHRVEKFFRAAHFSLYGLRWLEKAMERDDHLSFLKNEYELLEHLVSALFALNQKWFADEKRLEKRIERFEFLPIDFHERLASIALRGQGNCDLRKVLKSLKLLFKDAAEIAKREHPNWVLPMRWD